jgi:hypothetical protein
MNVDELEMLCDIHHDRWPEIILGDQFSNTMQHIMMKYERQIVEMKVELYEGGMSEEDANKAICLALNLRPTTLSRYLRDIKYKFRNKMDLRVYKLLNPSYNYTRGRRKWRKGVRL